MRGILNLYPQLGVHRGMHQPKEAIFKLIACAHEQINRRLQARLDAAGVPLTADQFRIMQRLWEAEGTNQQQLACALRRNRGSVTRILDVLERKGLVCRRCDDGDKRVNKVCLTAEGRRWQHSACTAASQALADASQGLHALQQDQLQAALRVVIQNLEAAPIHA